MSNKSDTLNGGRDLKVRLVNGEAKTIRVRQLRTGKWEAAFPLIVSELKLVAHICELTPDEMDEIDPDHYEAIRAAVWEVNAKGFFGYAARTRAANQSALLDLPPEMLKEMSAKIASTMSTPSPTSPPRPG